MPDAAQFLERLHRGGKWAYLWTAEGSRSAWYPVGKPLPSLGGGARNVYFGIHPSNEIPRTNSRGDPAPPEGVRARRATIVAVNCLFAELDAHDGDEAKGALLARIEDLDPSPSVVVDSGGGYHCYWLLADTWRIATERDRQRIDALQKGWVAYVGGDDGAKDLARMLRLPGTRNYKYVPPRPVRWVRYDLERAYALPTLARAARAVIPRSRGTGRRTGTLDREPDLDAVAQAVAWLDRLAPWRCDEYEPWIEVGMALSELGDAGLALWDVWSRRSYKYEAGACAEKWPTFSPGEGLTLGSLRHWASEDDPQPAPTGPQPPEDEAAVSRAAGHRSRSASRVEQFVQDPLPQM